MAINHLPTGMILQVEHTPGNPPATPIMKKKVLFSLLVKVTLPETNIAHENPPF